jgi:hypothetical protein
MTVFARTLGRRSSVERTVITLLRLHNDPAGQAEATSAAGRLVRFDPAPVIDMIGRCRAAGCVLFPPGAAFLSADEQVLVGLLALLQRRRLNADQSLAEPFNSIERAAEQLALAQLRLPYRAALAMKTVEGSALSSQPALAVIDPVEPYDDLRARAIAHVRAEGVAHVNALSRLGVSHGVLMRLVREGVLRHTGFGLYRFPPEFLASSAGFQRQPHADFESCRR